MTKDEKAEMAKRALAKSVLPVRDPVVDGLTCNADVPFPIHHELMEAAIDKGLSLSWLCAIYRAGVMSVTSSGRPAPPEHPEACGKILGVDSRCRRPKGHNGGCGYTHDEVPMTSPEAERTE